MPQAEIGQRVQVDISGLQAPGVSVGGGVTATGTIIGINGGQITVQLDVSFSGQNVVTVSSDRVALFQ
jgi:acetyl-CoA acetyltransferase